MNKNTFAAVGKISPLPYIYILNGTMPDNHLTRVIEEEDKQTTNVKTNPLLQLLILCLISVFTNTSILS